MKNILIIRPDSIGDFILFSAGFRLLRKKYKKDHITILVQQHIKDLAETYKDINKVYCFDKSEAIRNKIYFDALISRLNKKGYDTVIYPVFSREPLGDKIVINLNSCEKIAINGDLCNINKKDKDNNDKKYTRIIDIPKHITSEFLRNKIFIEKLTGNKILHKNYVVNIPLYQKLSKDISSLLNNRQFIVISPFPQYSERKWEIEKWSDLLNFYKHITVVICGNKADYQEAHKIIKLSKHQNIINLCGKTSLVELAFLMSKALINISVESGPAHISSAVKTQTVILMGGGHYNRFFPYHNKLHNIISNKMNCYYCNWCCKYRKVYCITDITVKNVMLQIDKTLRANKNTIFNYKINKWDVLGHYHFASFLERIGNRHAKKYFNKIIKISDDINLISGIYFHLGKIAIEENKIHQAQTYLAKCLRLNNSHRKARQYLKKLKK